MIACNSARCVHKTTAASLPPAPAAVVAQGSRLGQLGVNYPPCPFEPRFQWRLGAEHNRQVLGETRTLSGSQIPGQLTIGVVAAETTSKDRTDAALWRSIRGENLVGHGVRVTLST